MKKLLYGICFLGVLSLFISLTQLSCQKSVAQRNSSGLEIPYLILLGRTETKEVSLPSNAVDSLGQPIINKSTVYTYYYYVTDMDGSNIRKVPITLPAGLYVWGGGHLTPDSKSIIFSVIDKMGGSEGTKAYIYSCSLDGTNLKKLVDGSYVIHGVY